MKSATIFIKKSHATDVVAKALHPETVREISRTKVEIKEDDSSYKINIVAKDTSSLRAALNSYLRWMKVTEDTYRVIKENER